MYISMVINLRILMMPISIQYLQQKPIYPLTCLQIGYIATHFLTEQLY
jgi:hypothetical protein